MRKPNSVESDYRKKYASNRFIDFLNEKRCKRYSGYTSERAIVAELFDRTFEN